MISQLQKIFQLCEKHYFFKAVVSECNVYSYKCGPTGTLLRNNIYQEWLLDNAINAEENVLPCTHPGRGGGFDELKDPFLYAKELCFDKLPFGICQSKVETVNKESDSLLMKHNSTVRESYFHPKQFTSLRVYIFTHPTKSSQVFNSWQQKRKAWWRKFSGSPGRYTITDANTLPLGELVMIRAGYPWGMEYLETICHRGTKPLEELDEATRAHFEMRDGRHNILPHVIECMTTLDAAMMAFLCDAYEERLKPSQTKGSSSSNDNILRMALHLHRKLAPFKASFSGSSPNSSSAEDLNDLAIYLTRQLKRAGISVLLLPDAMKKSLESQHVRNDEMGIPYTVIMNESTLKNGIVGLRSRDTTLKEQLHITDLKSHMRQLLKNY